MSKLFFGSRWITKFNMRLGGDPKTVAVGGHTLWPSFPTLEVTLNTANDDLGFLTDC